MKGGLIAACGPTAIAAGLLMQPPVAAAAAAANQPAFWAPHDEIDYLDNLPRLYGCDELYYKYRDVLQQLGARPGLKIYTYGCVDERGVAPKGRPHVDLTYEVPKALPPTASTKSGLQAKLETLHLRPGHPKSLDGGDCILVSDMRDTVLASFSTHIDTGEPSCPAAHSAHQDFDLTVQTLLPLPGQNELGEKRTAAPSNS